MIINLTTKEIIACLERIVDEDFLISIALGRNILTDFLAMRG